MVSIFNHEQDEISRYVQLNGALCKGMAKELTCKTS
jgi:hypothetical protein